MIFIRRLLALFIGVLFITSFLVVATVLRVNGTLFESSFYVEHLRQADFFNFAYDELVPAAVEQIALDNEDAPIDVVEASVLVTGMVREVAPPEWLQTQTEQVIEELLPYALGGTDSFTLRVELADRITALGAALSDGANQQAVYDLVFDGFARPFVRDAISDNDIGFGIAFDPDEVIDAIQAVAAQAWIQEQMTLVVGEIVPYTTGEADDFDIRFDIGERIVVFKDEVKSLLAGSNVYRVVTHPDMVAKIDEQLAAIGDAPFDIDFETSQVVRTLDAIFPVDWIQGQVDGLLDEATAFVTTPGEATVFRLDINGPARAALGGGDAQLKVLLREIGAYDKVFSEGIIPTVLDQVMGGAAEDPNAPLISFTIIGDIGFSVTRGELEDLLRDELRTTISTQIAAQVEEALATFSPYLLGETERFTLVFDTGVLVDGAMPVLLRRLENRIEEEFAGLPSCSAEDAVAIAEDGIGGTLPACHPAGMSLAEAQEALGAPPVPALSQPQLETLCTCDLEGVLAGMTLEELREAAEVDFEELLSEQVSELVPREFTFTEADLRAHLSVEHQERLDDVRGWIRDGFVYGTDDLRSDVGSDNVDTLEKVLSWTREGFTFSDADLRELVGPENQEMLEAALGWTRNGFTFTEVDLREAIDDDATFREMERVRGYVATARSLSFLLYVIPFGLLGMVTLLGGRGWRGRGMWASAFLGIAAATLYAAAGPVYSNVAVPEWDKAAGGWLDESEGVAFVALEKGIEVAQSVVGDFVAGLTTTGLVFFVASFVAFVVLALWPRGGLGFARGGRGMVYDPSPEPPSPPTPMAPAVEASIPAVQADIQDPTTQAIESDAPPEEPDVPGSDDEPPTGPGADTSDSALPDIASSEQPDAPGSDDEPPTGPGADTSDSALPDIVTSEQPDAPGSYDEPPTGPETDTSDSEPPDIDVGDLERPQTSGASEEPSAGEDVAEPEARPDDGDGREGT